MSLGIGKSVAAAALAHGASVIISSSSQTRVEAAIASLQSSVPGSVVSGTAFNVRDAEAIRSFLTAQGKFDHFVSVSAEWTGPYPEWTTIRFIPLLKRSQGHSLTPSLTRRPRDSSSTWHLQNSNNTLFTYFSTRYWAPMTAGMLLFLALWLQWFMLESVLAQHIHKNNLINPGGSFTMTTGVVFNRPIPGWGLVSGVAGAIESATRGLAMDLKPLRQENSTWHLKTY